MRVVSSVNERCPERLSMHLRRFNCEVNERLVGDMDDSAVAPRCDTSVDSPCPQQHLPRRAPPLQRPVRIPRVAKRELGAHTHVEFSCADPGEEVV